MQTVHSAVLVVIIKPFQYHNTMRDIIPSNNSTADVQSEVILVTWMFY